MCDCPRGYVPASKRQLIKVTIQTLGGSFSFPMRQQPSLMICDTAVRAPKTVSWPLDLGAGGPSGTLPPAPGLLLGPMNLMRGSEVMARSAHQAS